MGYAMCMGFCVACKAPIKFNPVRVPSITVNGTRQPLCKSCFNRWNQIHRTSKGLPAEPLAADAYTGCDESEL
jgi:hypothetical protein